MTESDARVVPNARLAFLLLLVACSSVTAPPVPEPLAASSVFEWDLPPGFPVPSVPAANPMSAAKVELGRHLFYDQRLSVNGEAACASCHRQELAFSDGRSQAIGATGEVHPRGAMSLTNVAYNLGFAWADPTLASLEEQARVPMFNQTPVELGLEGSGEAMIRRLTADRRIEALFAAAFPQEQDRIRLDNVLKALAAFERTLISGNSAYDRWLYRDERAAVSEAARRGMRLFFSERLGCFKCHSGFNFSAAVTFDDASPRELEFHNTGLYNLGGKGAYPSSNRGLVEHTSRPRDMGRFRAPTLRNVAVTAPYMHDGSIATLPEVLDHYAAGGRSIESGPLAGVGRDNPYKSSLVTGFSLTVREKEDVVAFLESLTDEDFLNNVQFGDPRSVP